jgi:hypothetical protein
MCGTEPESAEHEESIREGHAQVHRLDLRAQDLQHLCTKNSLNAARSAPKKPAFSLVHSSETSFLFFIIAQDINFLAD